MACSCSLFLILLTVTGCDREEDERFPSGHHDPIEGDGEMVPINVKVDGVDEFLGGAVTRSGEILTKIVQPLDSTYDSGYDVETTIESLLPVNPVQTRGNMANMQFRVVAYKNNSITAANYAGTAVYSTNASGIASIVANTATPAAVSGQWVLRPGTYAFVFYSYGTNSAPAALSGNWSTTVTHNQDFMLCQKTGVDVKADASGQCLLSGISFSRQCAQLQLCVVAKEFNNNTVQQCAATISGLSNGPVTWNASQPTLPVTGTSGTLNVAWTNPNATTVNSNVYKVLPQTSRTLTIKFTTLKIGNGQMNNAITVSATNRIFSAAGNYKITVSIVPNYISVRSYKWARGNLYKSGSNFYFEASQSNYHGGATEGGFIGWNTLDIGVGKYNSGNYSTANDPCYQVVPPGTWETPSDGQLQDLINAGITYSGSPKGFWFGGNNGVFLLALGSRNQSSTAINNSISRSASWAFYWSRTPSGKTAKGLNVMQGSPSSAGINDSWARADGRTIRCVKR